MTAGEDRTNGRGLPRRAPGWLVLGALGILMAVAFSWGGWLGSGGRLFWVGSPSMGRAAPVGSLVATEALGVRPDLRVGEVIVFRPWSDLRFTFIHRIYRIEPDGRYMTKGDLNPTPDPWTITAKQISGTPVAIIPAIGWVYKLSTWLLFSTAAVLFLALVVRGRLRTSIVTLGQALIVAIPFWRYRILLNSYLYGARRVGTHISAQLVNSGVLPLRVALPHGKAVVAAAGQEVVVRGTMLGHAQRLPISGSVVLPWWGWVLAALFCFTPLLVRQLTMLVPVPAHRLSGHRGRQHVIRRRLAPGM